jgi:MarR family transcriptional regulator, organic hydroperoxide resistance regulator
MPKKSPTLSSIPTKQTAVKRPVKPKPKPAATDPVLDNDLQNSIPYLIARAGVRMGQAFTRELRKFDMTLTEWRVCSTLSHLPHQRLSEVALNTSTEQSTLSRVVDGLLQRGWLIRDRADGDARALALSLTPEGLTITQHLIPMAQLYERVSLKGFSTAQADQLRDMLKRLYDNMAPLDHAP